MLITHLGEVVRHEAHDLLSREDLKTLVDKVKESSPAVVDELIPNVLTMGTLHRVLCLLLEEHVPISNLTRIWKVWPITHRPLRFHRTHRTRPRRVGACVCDRFRDTNRRLMFWCSIRALRLNFDEICTKRALPSNRPVSKS